MKDKFYIEFETRDGTKENPRIEAICVELSDELITDMNAEFQVGPTNKRLWRKLKKFVKNNMALE